VTRAQLSDEEWKFVEPYLPIGEFGPYPERLREQFEGVIWRFRTGSQWREVPERFGAWQTVYNRCELCGAPPASSIPSMRTTGGAVDESA
jgi:transposase